MIVIAVQQQRHIRRHIETDFEDIKHDLRGARRDQSGNKRNDEHPRINDPDGIAEIPPDEQKTDQKRCQRYRKESGNKEVPVVDAPADRKRGYTADQQAGKNDMKRILVGKRRDHRNKQPDEQCGTHSIDR